MHLAPLHRLRALRSSLVLTADAGLPALIGACGSTLQLLEVGGGLFGGRRIVGEGPAGRGPVGGWWAVV